MIAAIVRTHRIREAMSERFHWFGWGKICSYCDCLSWSRSFNICNNSFDHLVLASSGGFEHWQWRSNQLPTLHQWVLPQLGRQHLHPAGSEIGRSFFEWFIYISIYIYIHTAQIAAESSPIGKSSERKCFIVTLSAKVAQSTRRGVPLMLVSKKEKNHFLLFLHQLPTKWIISIELRCAIAAWRESSKNVIYVITLWCHI